MFKRPDQLISDAAESAANSARRVGELSIINYLLDNLSDVSALEVNDLWQRYQAGAEPTQIAIVRDAERQIRGERLTQQRRER